MPSFAAEDKWLRHRCGNQWWPSRENAVEWNQHLTLGADTVVCIVGAWENVVELMKDQWNDVAFF